MDFAFLGMEEPAKHYADLREKIREAFIGEYAHADGAMDADFQSIYVMEAPGKALLYRRADLSLRQRRHALWSGLCRMEDIGDAAAVHAEVSAHTQAVIELPNMETVTVGSGSHDWLVPRA